MFKSFYFILKVSLITHLYVQYLYTYYLVCLMLCVSLQCFIGILRPQRTLVT